MKSQKGCMGVGDNLELLLNKIGVEDKQKCRCKAFALALNQQGIAWCEEYFVAIINEMANRGIDRTTSSILLRASIRLAKQKGQ